VRLLIQHAGPKLTMCAAAISAAAMIDHRKRRLSQKSVIGPRRDRAGWFMPGL